MAEQQKKSQKAKPFSVASINVDSLKQLLHRIGRDLSFADESARSDYAAQVDALHNSGNPNAEEDSEPNPGDVANGD